MIALYIRLSEADGDLDGDKAESNSVSNQRKLLADYVAKAPELAGQETHEFIDDGFTGSNFDKRPAFNQMLECVKAGMVTCVICKDLSRFGRDYVDAGRYIEQVFPFMRVRFIAIGDNYDSDQLQQPANDAINLGLRNIMNASYSRELSVKIKSANASKWKRGKHINSVPLFGYRNDPQDCTKLLVDEEAAEYVRLAFELAASGLRPCDVARELNRRGVPGPGKYKMDRGIAKAKYGVAELKNPGWDGSKVSTLLRNVAYLGTLVGHKEQVVCVGRDIKRAVPEEERYVTENAHEALVDTATFEAAQKVLVSRKRRANVKKDETSPLVGFVRRAGCGHTLTFNRRKKGNYFLADCACAREAHERWRIYERDLESAVAKAIAREKELMGRSVAEARKKRAADNLACRRADLALEKAKRALDAAREKRRSLYERYALREVEREDYLLEKKSIDADIAASTAEVEQLEAALEKARADAARNKQDMHAVSALCGDGPDKLDRATIGTFVDCVIVHGPDRIEVRLKHPDALKAGFER
ncbi:recombinase family protein [Paraeggerthella hongkongensis]|uniref:recombinase family protein n=1 Tax=Paraeggerthella hominis TaxID=2897351 RepID=UPI001C0F834F|nr:recombinase family protein [Paraeggerthella hongkongensis]MCD2434271.1 recombinase family protein [Paraeggerthella hominis]